MKPICVKCQLFFRPAVTGVHFEEGMPKDNNGTWGSYKLWTGDLWRCKGCGAAIIVGVGRAPIAEHHEIDYAFKAKMLRPIMRVDDC